MNENNKSKENEINMSTINLEKYREAKIEYDKEIRRLDYEIVEVSVQMYDTRESIENLKNPDVLTEKEKLRLKVISLEEKEQKFKADIWQKIQELKRTVKKILDKKEETREVEEAKFAINKIQDVYFNIHELIEKIEPFVSNYYEEEEEAKTEKENIKENQKINCIKKDKTVEALANTEIEQNQQEREYLNKNEEKVPLEQKQIGIKKEFKTVEKFDIPKQRIVDFENLLMYIYKMSVLHRTNIEKCISKFIINYNIIKNSDNISSEFNNLSNKYIYEANKILEKIERQENLEDINKKINEIQIENKELQNKTTLLKAESENMQKQVEELMNVHFVSSTASKILEELVRESNEFTNINVENSVFIEIKEITKKERMNHIIKISKWTKNIEEKLKEYQLEETDFQFILYLIRQTENICNGCYEQIANYIVNLCDSSINLEELEHINKLEKNKMKLQDSESKILRDGIETIKRKYLKLPFIRRKVAYILNAKQLT